jgi:glutathione S-transferase
MPLKTDAAIEITAFRWVPEGPRGLVKDLRARWALEEAGLDYRERLIGQPRPTGYRCEQPFEQVPCLRDEKVQLFESGAIVQYIGEKSGTLLPRDAQGRYRAIQWCFAAVSSIEPFVQFRTLLDSFWADQEWAAPATPTFDQLSRLRLGQLAEWLGDKEWLETDGFTIGDIMMVTVLRLADRGRLLAETPNLSAYVKRGEARPAFKQALADQLGAFAANEPQVEGAAA